MNKRTNIARGLSLLLALLLALSVFAGCSDENSSSASQPSSQTGSAVSASDSVSAKTITVTVVHKDGSKKDFSVDTDADNLRGALEPDGIIAGEESDYGLFVKTVDGETADDANQEWWCVTKGGEMLNTGVDDTKIADGDAYEFTLTVGY